MFNSLNSTRFNRTLRAAALAVTIASLAAACGSTTDTPATQVGVALPDLTNVTESSPAPTDTTAPSAGLDSETSGSNPQPAPTPAEPPVTDPPDNRVPLVVPEGAELTIFTALAADNNTPGEAAKESCSVKGGGTVSHGSTATIVVRDPEAKTTRTATSQCQDGAWVTISDITVNDAVIVVPEEPEDPAPIGQIPLPPAPDQVATD
jgi:hypothetical protein